MPLQQAYAGLFESVSDSHLVETRELRVIESIPSYEVLMQYLSRREKNFNPPTNATDALKTFRDVSAIFRKLKQLSLSELQFKNNAFDFRTFSIQNLYSQVAQAIDALKPENLNGPRGKDFILAQLGLFNDHWQFLLAIHEYNFATFRKNTLMTPKIISYEKNYPMSSVYIAIRNLLGDSKSVGSMTEAEITEISAEISQRFDIPKIYIAQQAKFLTERERTVYETDHTPKYAAEHSGRILPTSLAAEIPLLGMAKEFSTVLQRLSTKLFTSSTQLVDLSEIYDRRIPEMIIELFLQRHGLANLAKSNFIDMITSPRAGLLVSEKQVLLDSQDMHDLMAFDWSKTSPKDGIAQAMLLISNLGLSSFTEVHLLYGSILNPHHELQYFLKQLLRKKAGWLVDRPESLSDQITRLHYFAELSKQNLSFEQRKQLVLTGLSFLHTMKPNTLSVLKSMRELTNYWFYNYVDLSVDLMDSQVPPILARLEATEQEFLLKQRSFKTKALTTWNRLMDRPTGLDVDPLPLAPFRQSEKNEICSQLF